MVAAQLRDSSTYHPETSPTYGTQPNLWEEQLRRYLRVVNREDKIQELREWNERLRKHVRDKEKHMSAASRKYEDSAREARNAQTYCSLYPNLLQRPALPSPRPAEAPQLPALSTSTSRIVERNVSSRDGSQMSQRL